MGGIEVVVKFLYAHDDDAELGTPVADMVVAVNGGAAETEDALDSFADDHGADVADVHLFGGVGGGVVY